MPPSPLHLSPELKTNIGMVLASFSLLETNPFFTHACCLQLQEVSYYKKSYVALYSGEAILV